EATNVASDDSRPKPLMAFAAVFGKKAMITAAAMGSQRVMERMLVIWPPGSAGVPPAADDARLATQRAGKMPAFPGASCEHPNEHNHSQEKHQRVVADIAGLEEAQEVADRCDDVAEKREEAVDQGVDAAPEELREAFERTDDRRAVRLIDVPLVLHPARDGRHLLG